MHTELSQGKLQESTQTMRWKIGCDDIKSTLVESGHNVQGVLNYLLNLHFVL